MKISHVIVPILILAASFGSASQAADSTSSQRSQSPPKANKEMQAVLDQLQKLGPKPIETLPPEEARRQPTPTDAVKALLQSKGENTDPEPVANVKNQGVSSPAGEIPIRIYTPNGDGPFPVILYIHGGGWVIADLDTYDSSPRALANAAQAVVISTHYRQAPEHPFPASHEDVFTVYKWVRYNARPFKGDPDRIAVAGESAGGNMAAAVCLMARDQHVPLPVHQLLIYPVAGTDMTTPSYQQNAQAKPLNKAMMEWFANHEFKNPQDKKDPRIDLIHADLRGLPSATVITDEIDPLRSEGKMLADSLKKAGVNTSYKNYDGVTHEFFGMGAVLGDAKAATKFAAGELKNSFNPAQSQAVLEKTGR